MTSRFDRLEALLERAIARPHADRMGFVDRETAGDPGLRAELASLLEASDGAAAYVSRLRQDLLEPQVDGALRRALISDDATDPWIGRVVSQYEILDRIGGGGMGVIYRAHDTRLDRQVVLKFIAPELRLDSGIRERFVNEARAASALDHPNICTIHEIAETDDGRSFMVMPAYDGETLRARIERGPLGQEEALDIVEQIARGLAAAHGRGIVHGDVKPENVFITHDRVVKLLDFGLAHRPENGSDATRAVEGTVAYMSPEQVDGERASAGSDVWALGVMLFEMLSGVRPFTGPDARTVLERIRSDTPDLRARCAGLAPDVVHIADRALAKTPADRYPDAQPFLDALHERLSSRARTMAEPPVANGFRQWALWIGAGLAAAALVVSVVTSPPPRDAATPFALEGSPTLSHVLWVDDYPENNAELVGLLQTSGVNVTTVRSTTEAMQRYDPAVHELVVSDVGRYEGDDHAYRSHAGFELLERLRDVRADVRLIFFTSPTAATTLRDDALAAGAIDIVPDSEPILRLIGF